MVKFLRNINKLKDITGTRGEYIPPDIHLNISLFCYTGMWPPLKQSCLYTLWTTLLFATLGITFPLSQFMNVFFVNSIERAVDTAFFAITFLAGTLKAINIYKQQSNIRQIFALHKQMLQDSNKSVDDERCMNIVQTNLVIVRFFLTLYFATWSIAVLQAIFSNPENRLWPSTYNLPYEFAKSDTVYLAVLFYQINSNLIFALWIALEDTFPVILILMLIGHVDKLRKRLENLCVKCNDGQIGDLNFLHYRQLKESCIFYENCLR